MTTINNEYSVPTIVMPGNPMNLNKLSFFEDLASLKVMLVLYRDNPDLTLEKLQTVLEIESKDLNNVLERLIDAELVQVRNEGGVALFTLSPEARMCLSRFESARSLKVTA